MLKEVRFNESNGDSIVFNISYLLSVGYTVGMYTNSFERPLYF